MKAGQHKETKKVERDREVSASRGSEEKSTQSKGGKGKNQISSFWNHNKLVSPSVKPSKEKGTGEKKKKKSVKRRMVTGLKRNKQLLEQE